MNIMQWEQTSYGAGGFSECDYCGRKTVLLIMEKRVLRRGFLWDFLRLIVDKRLGTESRGRFHCTVCGKDEVY